MTISEARLWNQLKSAKLGVRFRRQVPVGDWIVDFACMKPKLVIEVDGSSHDFRDETDRTSYLETSGFEVLRFTNYDVASDVDSVVRAIRLAIDRPRFPPL